MPHPRTLRPGSTWIGFDLGHGESAAALAREGLPHPEILEIVPGSKSILSAVAQRPAADGSMKTLLGRQAVQSESSTGRVKMHFKGSPLGRPGETPAETKERNEVVQTFARAVIDSLRTTGSITSDETQTIVVGCPSSWTIGETSAESQEHGARSAYQSLLAAAGLSNVKVVPESRAAFMEACESGRFSPAELKEAVLVIDIGSSTTDFTVVINQHESPQDFGHPALGAGLIDESIFRRALAAAKAESAALAQRHEPMRWGLMFKCRQAKEDYFRDEDNTDGPASKLYYEHQDHEFKLKLDAAAMRQILDEPQPALGGLSWRGAYAQSLDRAASYLKGTGTTLTAVLLTGGPSRMKFVRDMTRAAFGKDSTGKDRVRFDHNPEHTIARGLAHVGLRDALVDVFIHEVEDLCEDAQLGDLLRRATPRLLDRLVPALAQGVTDHAITPAVQAWRDGKHKALADLEDTTDATGTRKPGAIGILADQWLSGPAGREATAAAIVDWLQELAPQIQSKIDDVCRRHRIPTGAVRLEVPRDADVLGKGLNTPSPDVMEMDFLHKVVAVIVAVVVAKLAGGGGIALIAAGPIGLLVGAIIGVVAVWLGREPAMNAIKAMDIPPLGRKAAFALRSVEDRCRDMKPKVEEALRQALTNNSGTADLVEHARALIRADLLKRASDAKIHIGSVATV